MQSLVHLIPKSGGEYIYLLDVLGPIPAFLFSWVSTLLIKPSQLALVCISLAEYVVAPFCEEATCGLPDITIKFVASCCVCKYWCTIWCLPCLLCSTYLALYNTVKLLYFMKY